MNSTTGQDEPIYNEGYPEEPGWYDVLVDGEPDRLRNWRCQLSGRHHWLDINGKYLDALHSITWTGGPSITP